MRISEFMDLKGIRIGLPSTDQLTVIDELIELHYQNGNLNNKEEFKKAILKREEQGSTAIGMGIACPHGKSASVNKAGLCAVTVPGGVDYHSLDGNPTKLIFMIAAPEGAADTHLEVLSKLMTMLVDQSFIDALVAAKSPEEFLSVIDAKETEKDSEKANQSSAPSSSKALKIVGVTACPTGIAHTYMAAESLEKAAKALGYSIKVETDGSGGAKNVLTEQDIADADVVILACDKNIEMGRFDGKKLINASTSQAIHNPEELIDKATKGNVSVYAHKGAKSTSSSSQGKNESFGRSFYKHLMNGVSHMLPFVIGGGILIAIAFLLDDYSIDPSNFGMNTPVAAWFKTIGGAAFSFMLPILAGYIAMSIADRPGLAIGFVGGYLASTGATFAAPGGNIPSAFLGALVAGFVGGYLVLGLERLCDKLPKALEGIKPVLIYPVAGILMIGIVMSAVNPVVGALNSWITGILNGMSGSSAIALGALLGGMMAIDMGGPFNKAAYVFGTAALSTQTDQGYMIMAAVMIGGMVPPIAIALATILFKNKFTAEERKSGPVNFIMGLCFITEGAIPFAAADPLRVIPSCIGGSAVAGALSMAFGCTLMAPHGGIFVFPVVGHMGFYFLALIIGSLVGTALLGILKKKVN